MKAWILFALLTLCVSAAFTQQKYALVIGNKDYSKAQGLSLRTLTNPLNDAEDMAQALDARGWEVDSIPDGDLGQMQAGLERLKTNLTQSEDSYGFFFYAGHSVEYKGVSYLIPGDANIQSQNYLGRALSTSTVLQELRDAKNKLNIVVLDSCRNNPFSGASSGSNVSDLPAADFLKGGIVVYSTNDTASDNPSERNGLSTKHLLANIEKTPQDIEIHELFLRTCGDVQRASANKQVPLIADQFQEDAWLGKKPMVEAVAVVMIGDLVREEAVDESESQLSLGTLVVSTTETGIMTITGSGVTLPLAMAARGIQEIPNLPAGKYTLTMAYSDGKKEKQSVDIAAGKTQSRSFDHTIPDTIPEKPLPFGVGVSIGTAGAPLPLFTLTPQITWWPLTHALVDRDMYLNLGLDIGLELGWICSAPNNSKSSVYTVPEGVDFFSLYPFIHINGGWQWIFEQPFGSDSFFIGVFGGVGLGAMLEWWTYEDEVEAISVPALDTQIGFYFGWKHIQFDIPTISVRFGLPPFDTVHGNIGAGVTARF